MLTADSRDILGEMVNIGAGHAAAALGELVSAAVARELPRVSDPSPCAMSDELAEDRSSVTLAFRGALRGTGTLELPTRSARRLVSVLKGAAADAPTLDEERVAVLTELGNVVVNSVLGSLGNMAHVVLEYSPPEYKEGGATALPTHAVCASVAFSVELLDVHGRLTVMLEGGTRALHDTLGRVAPEIEE